MPARSFRRLAVAVSLSPRREALLAEARHYAALLGAQLMVVHVGRATEHRLAHMEALLERQGLTDPDVQLRFATGNPADALAKICRNEQIDLLILGALPVKSLKDKLFGTIAQQTLRKVACSVLLLPKPTEKPKTPEILAVGTTGHGTLPAWVDSSLHFAQGLRMQNVYILRQDSPTGLGNLTTGPTLAERRQVVGQGLQNVQKEHDLFDDDLGQDTPAPHPEVHIKLYKGSARTAWLAYAEKHPHTLFALEAPGAGSSAIWRFQRAELRGLVNQLPARLLVVRPGV